jgi:hypothetical protein
VTADLATSGVSVWQFIKKQQVFQFTQATFHYRTGKVIWSKIPAGFWRGGAPLQLPVVGNSWWLSKLDGIRIGTSTRHLVVHV